jgi:hypothetical protein
VCAASLGLAAAWVAAGSAGLMAHSMRHGLTWAVLVAAVAVGWPWRIDRRAVLWLAVLGTAAMAAVAMIASPLAPLGVLAVSLVLVVLAQAHAPAGKHVLQSAAVAVAVLAVYRLAYTSIPLVWTAADTLGRAFGYAAGPLWTIFHWEQWGEGPSQPLWVGATMGGVDYLVPMLLLVACLPPWFRRTAHAPRTWWPALIALAAVLVGHFLYLVLLAFANDLAAIPHIRLVERAAVDGAAAPAGTWAGVSDFLFVIAPNFLIERLNGTMQFIQRRLPWNLPVVALAIQCAVATFIFWHKARQAASAGPPSPGQDQSSLTQAPVRTALACAAVFLAAMLPLVVVLSWSKPDLTGKKIVLYEKGFLNWLKPEHGQYGRLSVGMYGMMKTFLQSLGAQAVISPDLSEEDLQDADAVVAIYPNKPWEEGQCERIWTFVRQGGTLLVMGEHTIREEDGDNRFNELLGPTNMSVPFDSAEFTIGGWLHSYDAFSHPTMTGLTDEQNQFGVVIGASVEFHWPARPLLVGRWGWTDFGDEAGPALLGNRKYDPGEKLGDVVLAAEQPLGQGKVICFGDPSMLTNGLTVTCHDYTSRLWAYVAGGGDSPQAPWRQFLGLFMAIVLVGLLIFLGAYRCSPTTAEQGNIAGPSGLPAASSPSAAKVHPLIGYGLSTSSLAVAGPVAAATLALAVSLWASAAITRCNWELLPDGLLRVDGKGQLTEADDQADNNLAYIDAGHHNADSPESWRDDGLGGLELTLMRSGYLPLLLPEVTERRLLHDAEAEQEDEAEANDDDAEAGRKGQAAHRPPLRRLRAKLLIVVAPAKPFSARERAAIQEFVRAGGTLIYMVGFPESGPSRQLLSELGFQVGTPAPLASGLSQKQGQASLTLAAGKDEPNQFVRCLLVVNEGSAREQARWITAYDPETKVVDVHSPWSPPLDGALKYRIYSPTAARAGDRRAAPRPLGHFKSPFFDGRDYFAYVRFHAGWPVFCDDPAALVVTKHPPELPLIVVRRFGRGLVAVIGDTCFAMTKNLEHEYGEPFEGMRENADFWHWFLALLRDRPDQMWFPPNPKVKPEQ